MFFNFQLRITSKNKLFLFVAKSNIKRYFLRAVPKQTKINKNNNFFDLKKIYQILV